MKSVRILAAGVLLASAAGFAQHGAPAAGSAPYAGLQSREIKALSAEDTQRLLQGQGMSLALAAELNGYPGPLHVLEFAEPLRLTAAQREQSQALMARHKAQARALGAQIVEAERDLDLAFAGGRVTPEDVTRLTRRIGELQGSLRASHLRTHLQETALLDPRQVAQYRQLRGYADAGGVPAQASGHPASHGDRR